MLAQVCANMPKISARLSDKFGNVGNGPEWKLESFFQVQRFSVISFVFVLFSVNQVAGFFQQYIQKYQLDLVDLIACSESSNWRRNLDTHVFYKV